MLYLHFHKRSIKAPLTTGTKREWSIRFKDSWLDVEYVKRIIMELDNSEVLGNGAVKNSELGVIPPSWLSATCKNTIMMAMGEPMVFASGFFADEAAPYIEEISSNQDVYMYMNHMFDFTQTQVATLIDESNLVVTGIDEIQNRWVQEYDYDERIWDIGWLPGQLERLGLA